MFRLTTTMLVLALSAATANAQTTAPTATMPADAPKAGANSFTEAQARARMEKAGFTAVSVLAKDADGIWRGKATMNGKSVDVSLDFKGDVVAK